ncbi:MAG: carboxypeptidase-like regulatory domain-containing protein [Chitinophagaceae bacterium]
MKKFLFFLCTVLTSSLGLAQAPRISPAIGNARPTPPSIGLVYGKLVDSTGRSMGDASIVILQNRFDTVSKKSKEVLLKGSTTQANGDFSLEELPVMGSLKLLISATGYQPHT